MGVHTDLEKRVIYITRPTKVKTRKSKGWGKDYSPEEEMNGDSIMDNAVRFGLVAEKLIDGRVKLRDGFGRYWKVVKLDIGQGLPIKERVSGWKQKLSHAKRAKSGKSYYQGYGSVNLDKAWLMSGKKSKPKEEDGNLLDGKI